MTINCTIDVDRLIQNNSYNSYTKFKSLLSHKRGHGNTKYSYKRVLDEEAQFITLFGVVVDIKTGNIALGLFPDPNNYVYAGSLPSIMAHVWFNKSSLPKGLDFKYLVNLLKIDPVYYQKEIVDEIFFALGSGSIDTSKSISVRYIRSIFKTLACEELVYFQNLVDKHSVISSLVSELIELYWRMEGAAKEFYNNFICEQYDGDITEIQGSCSNLEDIYKSRKPNLECLTIKYKTLGVPVELLNDLKSYGFDIKDRRELFSASSTATRITNITKKYSSDDIIDIGIALSSKFYARNVIKKELVLAYNFMDMLRSLGWDQNILFSLDLIVDYKSKNAWVMMLKKFHIYEILQEQNLSEKEFVFAIDTYQKSILLQVDTGVCYKRYPMFSQYKMVSYSPYQIREAGRVLDTSLSLLSSSLNI